jgi:hypothetical protein
VSAVNLKVSMVDHSVAPGELDRLLDLWYRVNAMRMGTSACAWVTAASIRSRLSPDADRR